MALTLLMMIIVLHVTTSAIALVLSSEESRIIALFEIDEESNYSYSCIYGSNNWTDPLRITALVLLLANQVLMMKASLWFFSAERPLNPKTSSPTPWATRLLIICWATFFVSEAWFLVGSVRNADQRKYRGTVVSSGFINCQTTEDGFFHRQKVFQGGAAFILLTSIASKMYHVFYVEIREKENEDGSDSTVEKLGTDTMV